MTTDQFKAELAKVDWYYHFIDGSLSNYNRAKGYFNYVAELSNTNPEWRKLWDEAKPKGLYS